MSRFINLLEISLELMSQPSKEFLPECTPLGNRKKARGLKHGRNASNVSSADWQMAAS